MLRAKDFRQEAWGKLKGNWGVMIAVNLVLMLIEGALAYLSRYYFGAIVELLVVGPLSLGLCIVSLSVIRKGETQFGYTFAGFKNFINALVAYIVVGIFTFLWSLLFIIPGIIKSYSYSMTMYVLADNPELSGNEARKRSMELMDGNKWRLFCLHFSFIGWILLSALTFGILMLWVAPYIKTAEAAFYNSLVKTETEQAVENSEPLNPEVTNA